MGERMPFQEDEINNTEQSDGPIESVQSYEDTEREESHRESTYHLPDELAEDLGHPMSRKGWSSYWMNRLTDGLSSKEVQQITSLNLLPGLVAKEITDAKFIERRTSVMQRLSAQLIEIDARIEYPEKEIPLRKEISFDNETETLYVDNENGKHFPLNVHDIGPDLEWGISYRPSPQLSPDIWRKIRKKSAIAEARMAIEGIDNEEMAKTEKISLPTTTISGKWIEECFYKGNNTGLHGVISERMAKNALLRLSKKSPELGLRVENSNAIEDAELKYDFKVQVDTARRGIATEPEGFSRENYIAEKRMIGIQFAAGKGLGKKSQIAQAKTHLNDERFRSQIKHSVDDIVLVKLKLSANARYQQWLNDGKPPGGPERYMIAEEIDDLIERVSGKQIKKNVQEV